LKFLSLTILPLIYDIPNNIILLYGGWRGSSCIGSSSVEAPSAVAVVKSVSMSRKAVKNRGNKTPKYGSVEYILLYSFDVCATSRVGGRYSVISDTII